MKCLELFNVDQDSFTRSDQNTSSPALNKQLRTACFRKPQIQSESPILWLQLAAAFSIVKEKYFKTLVSDVNVLKTITNSQIMVEFNHKLILTWCTFINWSNLLSQRSWFNSPGYFIVVGWNFSTIRIQLFTADVLKYAPQIARETE